MVTANPEPSPTATATAGEPAATASITARSGRFGIVVMVIGTIMAAWMTGGRALFGVSGDLVWWFAFTLGPVVAALQIMTGVAIRSTAKRGFRSRRSTIVSLIISWAMAILFGLTVPDTTPDGLASVLSLAGGDVALEIGIGFANPLGVIAVVMSIFALVFALGDARGPKLYAEED